MKTSTAVIVALVAIILLSICCCCGVGLLMVSSDSFQEGYCEGLEEEDPQDQEDLDPFNWCD